MPINLLMDRIRRNCTVKRKAGCAYVDDHIRSWVRLSAEYRWVSRIGILRQMPSHPLGRTNTIILTINQRAIVTVVEHKSSCAIVVKVKIKISDLYHSNIQAKQTKPPSPIHENHHF